MRRLGRGAGRPELQKQGHSRGFKPPTLEPLMSELKLRPPETREKIPRAPADDDEDRPGLQGLRHEVCELRDLLLAGLGGCGDDALNPHIGDHVAVVMLVVTEIQNEQTHAVDAPLISIFLRNVDDFLA